MNLPKTTRTMVVAGASGVVGRHLISHAKEEGWTIRTLSRSNQESTLWDPDEIVAEKGDSLSGVVEALEGSDLVVNLAGASLAEGKLGIDHSKLVMKSRIHATRALGAAYRKCTSPPPCWIQASAIGYYGEAGEEDVTEESDLGKL
ncbi:MAG: NAD-dependent epimerase/dehydratase family protein, partial [Planctomycetota bacterium]|nr:NAD-dependent epimerase/dehydratase family protein [Planctomycetota bacterium]